MLQQAHAIGKETGTESAVSRQIGLQMLDEIFGSVALGDMVVAAR
jgi:hypothetical protein